MFIWSGEMIEDAGGHDPRIFDRRVGGHRAIPRKNDRSGQGGHGTVASKIPPAQATALHDRPCEFGGNPKARL